MSSSAIRFAALAVDAVAFALFDDTLHVRLITTNVPAFRGKPALPGCLVHPSETAEDAVRRVLKKKAGIISGHIKQLYTFSGIDRDPRGRVVSVAHLVLLSPDEAARAEVRDAHHAQWVPLMRAKHLAYDHDEIVRTALQRLRAKLEYTDSIRHLLPRTFTLTALQHAYEIILKRTLDKRNFRKKLLATDMVRATGKHTKTDSFRPAALYAFAPHKGAVELL